MKTILAGLFVGLILVSLFSATIQAENMALSSSAAETTSLVTGRWGANAVGPVNLTADSPANDQNPAWSPDGAHLVFTSGRNGNNELWVMDDEGSDAAALTANGAENVNLPGRAWCPGNDRIVFASDAQSLNDEIFSIISDGTDLQRLTTTSALNWEPSWSPDCSQIIFQSRRSGNWDLWRMNANGSNSVRLTNNPADDWEPNWSPDGTTIVFQSLRSGNWDLWTMDVNGGELTNMTDDPAEDTDPSWSPDGVWIVYSSDRGGDDGDIWAIPASGGTPIQITDDPAYDGAPSWSPDGRRIAFESERSGNLDIWVVDAPASPTSTDHCTPLPPPSGTTVTVSSESELRNQATNAAPGTTILVSAGTYNLQNIVHVVNSGITIRGATGNRDEVILDAGGMGTGLTHGILIDVDADDVTIADLTIRNAGEHGVSIQGSDRPTLYNLHILDTGNQLVKVNPWENGSEDGVLACSRLEYTTTAPDDYTNGISAHLAHRWVVRDNQWYRIRGPGSGYTGPTILFWSESTDAVVERNLLVDCYWGVAFGNPSQSGVNHSGGIVRNNFFYSGLEHDVAIEMTRAQDWLVANNTALLLNPAPGLTWGMEARYSESEGTFAYNLTNMSIINRDGAQGTLTGNVTTAQSSWFVNAAAGDLHLLSTATAAIDQALPLAQVTDDFDGDARPIGPAPDVGADEYGAPSPTPTPTPTATPTHPPCDLEGDLDNDGDVDIADIMLVASIWHTSVGDPDYVVAYDLDGNGQIDIVDIMLVAVHWGENCATPTPTPTPTIIPFRLIQPTDLVYRGAFAYPPGDDWAYSGHALAYYPEGDPAGPTDGYPGSLYAAAHAWYDLVGEITIPEPVISDDFDDLPKASVLRPLADITEGWKDNCTYNGDCIYREVDGLEYLPNINKIVWNLRDWYNVAGYDQDSLGWSELDMTGAQGVWHIGEQGNDVFHNAKTCNYLFKAPESFASEYLGGKWLIAGNHRGAGAFGGSQGPTLYALAPWEDGNPPESGQNLDALALLYYPTIYPDCLDDPDECYFPNYRAKDDWGGGAWVQTADKSGILIFGRKALGDNCYGTPEQCGGDPCDPYKGYHAYPYEPQILFYDPEELKEVVAGTREPWEVVPYEVYSPLNEVLDQECATLGAAAYDQERGLIYVTEQTAGPWGETVVHVWEVRGDS